MAEPLKKSGIYKKHNILYYMRMARKESALVVVGSGPGIGSHVAAKFVTKGFYKVILMSRNKERLEEDAEYVRTRNSEATVDIITIDLADSSNVADALKKIDENLGDIPLECLFFNAARIGPSEILEWKAEQLRNDLEISLISLYTISQWAIPKLLKLASDSSSKAKPSFLVTSGGLYKNPFPNRFSLAACKAAQYNLVHSMHKAYTEKGVHCGLIVVQGQVKPDAKVTTPQHIADETWKLYDQEKGKGDLDVDIKDPDYNK